MNNATCVRSSLAALLFLMACNGTVMAQTGGAIAPNGQVATVVIPNDKPECSPSAEQTMLHRIEILEKAKNSNDPILQTMADQVRADIEKDRLERIEKENNPLQWRLKQFLDKSFSLGLALFALFVFVVVFIGLPIFYFEKKKL